MIPQEFIKEESARISQLVKLQDYTIRDISQVVVDLVELSKLASQLEDISIDIGKRIQELVQSLSEQV